MTGRRLASARHTSFWEIEGSRGGRSSSIESCPRVCDCDVGCGGLESRMGSSGLLFPRCGQSEEMSEWSACRSS